MIPRPHLGQTSTALICLLMMFLGVLAGCADSSGGSDDAAFTVVPLTAEAPTATALFAEISIAEVSSTEVTNVATVGHEEPAQEVTAVELLGVVTFETGFVFEGTEVGGLSGITYDREREVYYLLSDDRGSVDRPRFYTVEIDLTDGRLDEGDVAFLDITWLTAAGSRPFEQGAVDLESIELMGPGLLYISSEGDVSRRPAVDPFVKSFGLDGVEQGTLPLPDKFLPDDSGDVGVRNNKAFESLAVTPGRRYLYTAVESALVQDGEEASFDKGSPARLLEFDLETGQPGREFVYQVEAIPVKPNSTTGDADNGLVELQALDDAGTFLALERSYVEGFGNTIGLYETTIDGATDVSGLPSLIAAGEEQMPYRPARKKLLSSMAIWPDNVEGMTLGPELDDGRKVIILVSDNNFNPNQITQFIALAWVVP